MATITRPTSRLGVCVMLLLLPLAYHAYASYADGNSAWTAQVSVKSCAQTICSSPDRNLTWPTANRFNLHCDMQMSTQRKIWQSKAWQARFKFKYFKEYLWVCKSFYYIYFTPIATMLNIFWTTIVLLSATLSQCRKNQSEIPYSDGFKQLLIILSGPFYFVVSVGFLSCKWNLTFLRKIHKVREEFLLYLL